MNDPGPHPVSPPRPGAPGSWARHPLHGPHDPAGPPPLRRTASIRRSTTHDSLRPDGPLGPVMMAARGRDLITGSDGRTKVLATAGVDAVVDFADGRRLARLSVDPPAEGASQLVGTSVSSGFRQAVEEAIPGVASDDPLRWQLIDDLPTATLVGGYAIGAAGVRPPRSALSPSLQHPDLCAGWAVGGTILNEMGVTGYPPVVTGPLAPDLRRDDDPLAWHDAVEPLPPHGMRRRRRLDLWRDGERIVLECFLRDSHFGTDGHETVVHEYTVRGALDPATMRFTEAAAEVGALPWVECPEAVASAGRLVGAPAAGLRAWVRNTFVGPTTCTHLNDTLRSLEAVDGLASHLPA
ncbi:DUF2889 domain-containing protein [Acidiferrimicrobium sp. IK]|uniref:DUF2889 domain-containing protein n=1 Tax=Acidiferrimicrobium sp. IK TaxID=2871700 RepID=UPI0021CB54B2|nr:DUF2889 domain-containing protein [Acidiferrimicrobium sp. IK]MCU4184324.1 DUF2889 domain-containing protein [Acidiferrimicrobium sp. IK]